MERGEGEEERIFKGGEFYNRFCLLYLYLGQLVLLYCSYQYMCKGRGSREWTQISAGYIGVHQHQQWQKEEQMEVLLGQMKGEPHTKNSKNIVREFLFLSHVEGVNERNARAQSTHEHARKHPTQQSANWMPQPQVSNCYRCNHRSSRGVGHVDVCYVCYYYTSKAIPTNNGKVGFGWNS